MACPNLYLGPDLVTNAPPSPFWRNRAILPLAGNSPTFTFPGSTTIRVDLRNDGPVAPQTRLELYWSDPATGFMTPPNLDTTDSRYIGHFEPASVDPATEGPHMASETAFNFAWTIPMGAATLPNGHACLLARVRNLAIPENSDPMGPACASQIYNHGSPTTDPLTAIRNIHIDMMGMMMMKAGAFFAFGASNNLPDEEDTELSVRVLDTKQDRANLEALVDDPFVDRFLSRRKARLGKPEAVRLAAGRERHRIHLGRKRDCVPRFTHNGTIDEKAAKSLIQPGEKLAKVGEKPLKMPLLPGEMQQMILHVEPCGAFNRAYAVDIEHTGKNGQPIGGMTIIFVTPHDYFG